MIKLNVVGAVYNPKKQLLLIKRSIHDRWMPGYWALPGGKVEKGKKRDDYGHIESELKREILEETGVKIKNPRYLLNRAEKNTVTLIFLCEYKSGKPRKSNETEDVRWFSIREALKEKKRVPRDWLLKMIEKRIQKNGRL